MWVKNHKHRDCLLENNLWPAAGTNVYAVRMLKDNPTLDRALQLARNAGFTDALSTLESTELGRGMRKSLSASSTLSQMTTAKYFINHNDHTTTWEDPRIEYYTKKRFCESVESDPSDSEANISDFQSPDASYVERSVRSRCDEIPADFRDDSMSSVNSSHRSSNSEEGLRRSLRSAAARSTPSNRSHRSQRSGSERVTHERTHLSTRTSLRSERSLSKHRHRGDESHAEEPMKPLMESDEDQRTLKDSPSPEQTPTQDQTVASETAGESVESPKSGTECAINDETSAPTPSPSDHLTRSTLAVGPNPALRCARIAARGPDPSLLRAADVCLAKGPNPSLHRGPNPDLLGGSTPATTTTTSFGSISVRLSSLVLAR
ncbi:hypothetical protein SprV_0100015600 [Sparganum proliferum]